jgi:hypothetical protein
MNYVSKDQCQVVCGATYGSPEGTCTVVTPEEFTSLCQISWPMPEGCFNVTYQMRFMVVVGLAVWGQIAMLAIG